MKNWIAAAGLTLSASAIAASPLLPIRHQEIKNIIPQGYDASALCFLDGGSHFEMAGNGDLLVNWPAQFPNPKKSELFTGDYRLNCPNFTIERVNYKSITVIGLTPPQLLPLLNYDYDNLPYLYRNGNMQTEFGEGNVIMASTANDEPPSEEAVIAVRQLGSALKVLVFDGASQNVPFDPALPVEIFQKSNTPLPWQRMAVDWQNRVIVFDVDYPFPQ